MAPIMDTTAVPGTIRLVDVEHVLATRHLERGQKDIVLVPTPSNDPSDPLNWSHRRKLLSTLCVSTFTLFTGLATSVQYSVEVPLSEVTGISVAAINEGTGYMFLFAALGLVFWQPIALQYGKRPVYLFSTLATLGLTMWGPYCRSNGQWIGRNILLGFMLSPIEALPETSTIDVYFTHERGFYMSIYAFTLAGGNFLAPLICGFIAEYQGWRWVFYYPSIFLAVVFVFLFFALEETNYERHSVGIVEDPSGASSDTEGRNEKDGPQDSTLAASDRDSTGHQQSAYSRKTYLQKLSLFSTRREENTILRRVRQTIYFLSWPVIFYSGFQYGTYIILFNILNGTASIILSSPPYNFNTAIVGLSYVACLIGVILGSAFTGRFSDWLTLKLSRRNKGIMESEFRLWPFMFCVFIVPASLILWGVGAAHSVHWFGLIFAMFLIAMCNTCGITLSVNYMFDSYREIGSDAMSSIILVRNIMSFAIGYGITPWIKNMGYQNCFVSAAFVGMACVSAFMLMIFFGKKFRQRSREKYWSLVQENWEMGMGH